MEILTRRKTENGVTWVFFEPHDFGKNAIRVDNTIVIHHALHERQVFCTKTFGDVLNYEGEDALKEWFEVLRSTKYEHKSGSFYNKCSADLSNAYNQITEKKLWAVLHINPDLNPVGLYRASNRTTVKAHMFNLGYSGNDVVIHQARYGEIADWVWDGIDFMKDIEELYKR